MSIESDLRKEGIEVIKKLDISITNQMASKIADRLCNAFPEYNFDRNDLFAKLSKLDMYIAKIPKGKAEANYFYKNNSIYFSNTVDIDNIDSYAIHECIHFLQQLKDNSNNLIRLGLCDFTEFKVTGLALNEAAVQLATSKANAIQAEFVKYYDINIPTTSPNCYPLQCNLVSQMSYITSEHTLFESTFFSNDNFKEKFICLTNENVYSTVEKNLDLILHLEDKLMSLNYALSIDEGKSKTLNKKINNYRTKINNLFIDTQNLIISSYFDKAFSVLTTKEEIDCYRKKLYNYKDLIGTTEDYFFYSNYYIKKMSELERLYDMIDSGVPIDNTVNALTIPHKNRVVMFLDKIWSYLFGQRV